MGKISLVISASDILAEPDAPEMVKVVGKKIVLVGHKYEIETSRIKDYSDIVSWTHHLAGKAWATPELLYRFIEVACGLNGLDLYKDG